MAQPKQLNLGPRLTVPVDLAAESIGVLGQRGSGKSNALVVIAEELHAAGVPWVAIDPKGDWWGIRSRRDGRGPGLPIPVFGGLHGDLPLEPTAGAYVADLLVEQTLTAVLDVSRMSGGDLGRFLVTFCHRLFDRHQAEPHVRTVIFEEAHRYIPQSVTAATAATKEATAKIPLEGRAFGLGSITASQRSSRLHKDVLTQFSVLFAMRSPAKLDRDAIGGWVEEHDVSKELLRTLPELDQGEAWLWSPALLHRADRVRFRQRATFDSGATPKVGQSTRVPRTLADVDLAAIKEAMAETIERAKADDPAELRKRIRELERIVGEAAKATADRIVEVRVPVVPPTTLQGLRITLDALDGGLSTLAGVRAALARTLEEASKIDGGSVPRPRSDEHPVEGGRSSERPSPREQSPAGQVQARHRPAAVGGKRTAAERILDAIAWWGMLGREDASRAQVAFMAGYSPSGGAFQNLLGRLRTEGLLDYPAPGRVSLTAAGYEQAQAPAAPPTNAELQEAIYKRVGGAKARILAALVEAHPRPLARGDLGAMTGYTPTGGAFQNNLGALRSLGLLDYPESGFVVATDLLFVT